MLRTRKAQQAKFVIHKITPPDPILTSLNQWIEDRRWDQDRIVCVVEEAVARKQWVNAFRLATNAGWDCKVQQTVGSKSVGKSDFWNRGR